MNNLRRGLVVGNWKLHGTLAGNQALLLELLANLKGLNAVDFAVCVPYVYLFQAQQLLSGSNLLWGSQNVSQYDVGAYTSCISAAMIAEFGCQFVILAHSERRMLRLESHEVTAQRFLRAIEGGLTPIYCVGEAQAERDAGLAEAIVEKQVLNMLHSLDDDAFMRAKQLNMVVAYEPVWAIDSGQHASPQQAQSMHACIRQLIAARDPEFAQRIRIIYGGSLKADNAYAMLSMPDIDGALLGRSALVAESFTEICRIANRLGEHDEIGCP